MTSRLILRATLSMVQGRSGHGLLRLLGLAVRKDALGVYDYGRDFFSHLLPGEGFMNFGLWDRPLDEIAPPRRLAEFLLERAELQPGQRALHVGSGLGCQDVICCERYGCVVVGLDINPAHVRLAREAAVARGLGERVHYVVGSGTALPAEVGAGFDRVLALECLDEMECRFDFFREAQRVLRPTGVLVVCVVYLKRAPQAAEEWRYVRLAERFWNLAEPLYTEDNLRRDLRRTGFDAPEIVSIADRVYRPLLDYLQRHAQRIEQVRRRFGYPRLYARAIVRQLESAAPVLDRGFLEYAIVRARKADA
jgi:cyclopropane fatty-acyl-phospholipid synthase-like methyltransferase